MSDPITNWDITAELPAIKWDYCTCCGWEKDGFAPVDQPFVCMDCQGHRSNT